MAVHKAFIERAKLGELILTRLMPGDDLFASLKKIVKDHGIERGIILSAIGSLLRTAKVMQRNPDRPSLCLGAFRGGGVALLMLPSIKDVVFRNVKINIEMPVKLENTNEMEEKGPFELLSLEGNIFPSESDGEPIIHADVMLGSPSGGVMDGHLFRATIFTTTEIFIGKIVGSSVYKTKSDVTGLMELLKK